MRHRRVLWWHYCESILCGCEFFCFLHVCEPTLLMTSTCFYLGLSFPNNYVLNYIFFFKKHMWSFIKIQNVCPLKNKNQDHEIKGPTDWKKIFTNQISKGLVPSIHKEFLQLSNKRTGNPLKTSAKDPKTFLQWRYLNEQWAHENMLNIMVTGKMQIRATERWHLPCTKEAKNQRQAAKRFGESSDKLIPRHCWWECTCHFGNSLVVSQNVKKRTVSIGPSNSTL